MTVPSKQSSNCRLVKLSIDSVAGLQASYMPFVENGGVFIPGAASPQIGAAVFVMLRLPESREWLPLVGRVIWKATEGAQGDFASGVGVQFVSLNAGVAEKIQQLLSGLGTDSESSDSVKIPSLTL